MEGYEVVAMPQELPVTSGTCAESGWGTCEELLLVSAVKRHGVKNWNLISEEVKARAISLNVSPLYFSEAACEQKYDILKGRYASSSSSSRSRNEDLISDIYWFEELRKSRVAHLKRELEHYDGSIGNLRVKIKRLKAGKAPETSVSTQLRMSITNSQSNEEVGEYSRCEISVQRAVDIRLEADYNHLHDTPVTLESIRISREITSSQTPTNLKEQVLSESEQLHDAIKDLPDASLTYTDLKATVNVINNTPFLKRINGGNDVEEDRGENSSVLSLAETQFYETPSVPADDLQDVEADKVCTSNKDEQPELPMSRSGYQLVDDLADSLIKHEAGDIVGQALDKDEVEVGILDLQIGREMTVKMDVEGLGIMLGEYGQEGMDRVFVTSADSIFNVNASKEGGFEYAKAESHARQDVVVLPSDHSYQRLVSSGNVRNAEHEHAEPNTVTEERVNLSKNESGMGALEKKQTEEVDCHPVLEVGLNKQVHVALPLDFAKAELKVQLGTTVSEYPDDVTLTIPSIDEVLTATRKISRISEGCHHFHKDVASTIRDEVISSEQMKLLLEESNVKVDESTVHAVKELPILGAENGGLDRNSDGLAMKRASTPKESDKIRFSGVIPVASFTNSESIVHRDGAIVVYEKADPRGSGRRSGIIYTYDMSKGSPGLESHIVISLDGPGKTTPSSENTSITPANAEDIFPQLNTPTRSDVICDTEAIGIIEEQHISAQSSRKVDSCEQKEWEMPHETPSAMDLLLEVYGTGQENASESVLQTVQAVQCFAGASVIPVSSNSISESKSMEHTPTQAVRVDHDGKMSEETTTDSDKQPRTSERSSRRDLDTLGQDLRDSRARYSIELAENIGSVSDQDRLLNSTEEIQVELGERSGTSEKKDPPVYLGRSSKLARYASCVAEEIFVDMKLEFSKEELSGVDSEAELCSPLESLAGGLGSKLPTCHDGSDNVQDQYKNGCSDRNRERTQGNRDHVESVFDKSEARSPLDVPDEISPSSRRNHKEPRVPGKLFSLLEVFRNVSNHKSAIFFKGRQEDSRYNLLIRRHLDLNFVKTRLDEGAYSSSSEFFRDLLLIFSNGMVYYTRESVEFRGAKALFTEATKEMNRIFQTEALLKQDRPATRTREVKKPKAFAGVASPGKVVIPTIGATSSAELADTISPLISVPASGNKKRANSRLGLAETPTNSHSEGGAPRSASVNILGDPSSSRAEQAKNSQENDQEVNGRLKDRKNPQKGSGSSRGKPHREELLEGILLRNAASLGRPKLRDFREGTLPRIPAILTKGVEGENVADSESANMSEAEKEKMREKEVQGKEKDEIDDDDDGDGFLCKGKSLSKLIDLDGTPGRGPEGKSFPKSRPSATARVASNPHCIVSEAVGRSSRGRRKVFTPAKEPQAKKRMRR